MGIPGFYDQVGVGKRVALSKLAVEHFAKCHKKLRLAIDASIWLFQVKASPGGKNPQLRTIYYRLLTLMRLGIDPVFVFDGSQRPKKKRNREVAVGWESLRARQVRELLDHFGFVHHRAPGEAEAECAHLQQQGIVDLILSEDSDTLMFGALRTVRGWSSQEPTSRRGSRAPTHVNVLDAAEIKRDKNIDQSGMILMALMGGGDYDTIGIKGCGPQLAAEVARSNFPKELCRVYGTQEIAGWRDRLRSELRFNDSKQFSRKNPKVSESISNSFPDPDILESYLWPIVSEADNVQSLRQALDSEREVKVQALRDFLGTALEWRGLGGAIKYIRGMAPAMQTHELLNSRCLEDAPGLKGISGTRTHSSSDGIVEIIATHRPIDLVSIDLTSEETSVPSAHAQLCTQAAPDDEEDEESDDMEGPRNRDHAQSATGRRVQKGFDPSSSQRIIIPKEYILYGAKDLYRTYEAATKQQKAVSPQKPKATKTMKKTGMPDGAIENYFSKNKNISKQPLQSSKSALDKSNSDKPMPSKPVAGPKRAKSAAKTNATVSSSVTPWTMARENTQPTQPLSLAVSRGVSRPPGPVDCSSKMASESNHTRDAFGTRYSSSFAEDFADLEDLVNDPAGLSFGAPATQMLPSSQSNQEASRTPRISKPGSATNKRRADAVKADIRIRDSLPGAWAFQSPEESRPGEVHNQVEVVDLT